MVKRYTYHTRWEKKMLQFLFGARAVFLLFGDHQDSGSESCEIGIGVAGPIFAHEKNQSLYEKYISKLQNMGSKYCGNYSYLRS